MRTMLIHLLLAAVAAGAIAIAPPAQAQPRPVLCVMWNPCPSNTSGELVNWNGGTR